MDVRCDECLGIPLEWQAAKYKCGCRSQWLYKLFLLMEIPILRVYAGSEIKSYLLQLFGRRYDFYRVAVLMVSVYINRYN